MAYKAADIANKILAKATLNDGYGELISNLKLQKLLYYMQGFHLAKFDTPLFEEDIEAWTYGPVVPSVYKKYKGSGNMGISPKEEPIVLNEQQEELFDKVFEVYGEFSAIGLMNMTHKETPWMNTSLSSVISRDIMKDFFKKRFE